MRLCKCDAKCTAKVFLELKLEPLHKVITIVKHILILVQT